MAVEAHSPELASLSDQLAGSVTLLLLACGPDGTPETVCLYVTILQYNKFPGCLSTYNEFPGVCSYLHSQVFKRLNLNLFIPTVKQLRKDNTFILSLRHSVMFS